MPFGSLSSQQRVAVLLELLGGPKFAAGMRTAAAETQALARAQKVASAQSATFTRRTFFAQQALFTLRRYAFYGTLALTAMAASVVKVGYSYLSAMQTARVSLSPVIKDQATLNNYLNQLFTIAKYSPFVITDLAVAFRQLYAGLHPVGIEGPRILRLMQALTDYMSAAGKTSPGQMQRVALAIQHLAYAGRVTGYAANQLARLGIPVAPILRSFGVTDIRNLSNQNISADAFIKAIIGYSNTGQFRNAARRQALRTLPGLIQVARDTISQISGRLIQKAYGGQRTGIQGLMTRLFAPGGSFDKISSKRTGTGIVFEINRQITGNTGLARGLFLLLSITKNLGMVFARVLVPAFVIGLHALIVFWPVLQLVNLGLGFLSHHATVAKFIFAGLAAEFIVTHFAALGLWTALKIVRIATFGAIPSIKSMIKWIKILRTVEIAGLITRLRTLVFTEKLVLITGTGFRKEGFLATGVFAKFARIMFRSADALKATAIWANRAKFAFLGWAGYILAAVIALRKLNNQLNQQHKTVQFRGGKWNPVTWLAYPGQKILGNKATGGMVNNPTWVGERGPELLFAPTGSRIVPNQNVASTLNSRRGLGGDDKPIVVQVVMDRKVIAEAVARAKADKAATR